MFNGVRGSREFEVFASHFVVVRFASVKVRIVI